MDTWQNGLYTKLKNYVSDTIVDDMSRMGFSRPECYVLMKALEAAEKAENPLSEVSNEM